ncbi:MAG: FAD-binding oxidoreductase [Anaerolineales bacterium]
MRQTGKPVELTNWSKSACSPCFVYEAGDVAGITQALSAARDRRLSVIPHGAGHSYTDAALNTRGVVIDTTPMRRILSWDPTRGIMRVEPGVTLLDMVRTAWKDGWWPSVSPSTPQVTIGGCTAMNVNGKNAWKMGPFGAHILSLDVLLPSGETCTLEPERDPQLFHAFVGSLGLLGILTSITVQLQRVSSGYVTVRRRPAASLAEIFSLFAEEQQESDFIEAWLDGYARAGQLGRGVVTGASLINSGDFPRAPLPVPGALDRLATSLIGLAANLGRPALLPGVRLSNRAIYGWDRWSPRRTGQVALFPYTFWPSAAFAGYHAMLPEGAETFQAFLPEGHAEEITGRLLRYTQQQGCLPIWCVIKRHQSDPFLLSYQVDGFSLELNYPRTRGTAQTLKPVLEHMIAMVIEAGGRFYLAKDHYLTHAQYRQSVGDQAVDAFLRLKQCYDPEMLLQSDLFRRVFRL